MPILGADSRWCKRVDGMDSFDSRLLLDAAMRVDQSNLGASLATNKFAHTN